ncbi:MAG: phosphoglycolate phosphatase [Pseudomonadota bacterium]
MNGATIVFDLDGTLVDTAPDLIRATDHVLALKGKPPVDPEFARPWISFGAMRMITEATQKAGLNLPDDEHAVLHQEFLNHYVENISHASRPFPGAVTLIERLQNDGAKLAICTNKRESLSRKLLSELGLLDWFDAIVGRDTLSVHKPHPRHLTEAIEQAGGTTQRAVMVGDSDTDVKTARAANVPVVGVTFGYTSVPMQDLNPDRLVHHYDAMHNALIDIMNCDQND